MSARTRGGPHNSIRGRRSCLNSPIAAQKKERLADNAVLPRRTERVCKIFCVSGCLLITAVNGHHT